MTSESSSPLRIAWLVPDDRGGGVVSVAQGCCRQAVREGHDATLLLLLPTTGRAGEFGGFKVQSLEAESPYSDAPKKLVDWLRANPQDILMVNGCEQADVAIPQVPSGTRVVYVVHDTADRYFSAALQNESCIDAIVAVSETVAARFRRRLKSPDKLRVIHNGTVFPIALTDVLAAPRDDNLVFLGGDNPAKGAYDVLVLWPLLQGAGFVGELHWFGHLNQGFRERIGRGAAIDRIALRGKQSRSSIFETAVRSKAVLMLSRGEPFGMATVECMGMGCLSVAWDVASGTKEIVGDGEGFFAPLGDFQALTRAVLSSLEFHRSRIPSACARIRENFSEEAMWSGYQGLIRELCVATPVLRPLAGRPPPEFKAPMRLYQLLPAAVRERLRAAVGRAPRLGRMLRDVRGR